ncbi:MAG: MHS family MFS transporter [Gemmatimonadota bacterium]|nr:MHS family MFS transporter [Gemmatimonadota bacterium]
MSSSVPGSITAGRAGAHPLDDAQGIWKVITASSVGTMIEWYDFYIFGSLAAIISTQFFPGGSPTAAFLKTLATFAVGFAVRPFGALVFGRIGDLIGRKFAFLATLLIMGGSTAAIGFLPGHDKIGIAAPIILVILRLLQGLALGGEYGGAAVYVAEHAPDGRRGFYTSFIQTTATLGLFLSLAVILIVRGVVGEDAFKVWGWRIPFILSLLLVGISYYIRMRLRESPLFSILKETGKTSQAPIQESFGTWARWKVFLVVLFGATAGQAVVWYTGQFYALLFLQTVLKVPLVTSYVVVAIALVLGAPLFVFFGSLSDRIGRKKIMMAGNLLAALLYVPIYHAMKYYSTPVNAVALTALVFVQVVFVTMVYGPIAAFLVEAFPAKIRYTSLSLPYHFGNGWFGGFLPIIATSLVARTGNIYAGLAFPIVVALITFVVGSIMLRDQHNESIWAEVHDTGNPTVGRAARA